MATPSQLADIAKRLRIHVLRMTSAAGSGHPTSCMSMAELTAVFFFHEMRFNVKDPTDWGNDEFVLSKGHAAPILWAAYAEAGIVPFEDLKTLRKIDSVLEGHPTPRMPWIKVATGSLGQGLAAAVGMAWAMRHGKSPGRVYCVLGDSECAEGSVWEAAGVAAHEELTNIVAIIDVNRLGQAGETMHGHEAEAYEKKFQAFGWETMTINGHDIPSIIKSLDMARNSDKPFAIIARTFKGNGVSFMRDANGWHGKAPNPEELERALGELGAIPEIDSANLVRPPQKIKTPTWAWKGSFTSSTYNKPAATRDGFGRALLTLGKLNEGIVGVDGEVRNSTREEWFFNEFPGRSINCYIAEQTMIGVAMGISAKGMTPVPSTFSAFFSRAHDQLRMAGISGVKTVVCGSHSGVSIGEDGPSQMGLEDIAMFRSIPGCVILYPSDAVSAEHCTNLLLRNQSMGYLRTARMETPILYGPGEKFELGGSKILRKSPKDVVTIVAAGVTVHEALAAADELNKKKINVRVIDLYSVQPLDLKTLKEASKATKGKFVVVEDHYPAGGIGEAVATALSGIATVTHLCVRETPRSGKADELLSKHGIDKAAIVKAVKKLV